MTWTDTLTDAQRKEIAWSRLYAAAAECDDANAVLPDATARSIMVAIAARMQRRN